MSKLTPPDISLRALAKLAGPIFIANISLIGSGTIDTVMAGQLGKDQLAGIALGLAATICVMMTLVGILQSLSPIAGHHYGAREFKLIGVEVQQNIWLAMVLSLIGMGLLMQTDMWIHFGKVDGEVARVAAGYLFFSALSIPGCLFARTFISVNAALSRPQITMWVSVGMVALKIPTNALFMYGLCGLPAMGGIGAGVSFFILNTGAFLAYYLIWRYGKFYQKMHADRLYGPRWLYLKEQLHVGLPIGLSTFFEVSSFTFMAIFISRLGAEAISAHQIVSNITSMCYMLPLSTGIATSVLIAQSLGSRWPAIALYVYKRSLKISVLIATVIVTLLFFFRGSIVALYTADPEVIHVGAGLLFFACIYHIFDAMQCVSSFALRGYRVTKLPMVIYGLMLWGVGLGGGYYVGFGGQWLGGPYGAYGFWGSTALGLVLTGCALACMALWVAKNFAADDTHTPEEISEAVNQRN